MIIVFFTLLLVDCDRKCEEHFFSGTGVKRGEATRARAKEQADWAQGDEETMERHGGPRPALTPKKDGTNVKNTHTILREQQSSFSLFFYEAAV